MGRGAAVLCAGRVCAVGLSLLSQGAGLPLLPAYTARGRVPLGP